PDARIEVGEVPTVPVRGVLVVVLENLCSNAVQHNDADAPWMRVDAAVADGWVTITVADDGPGIDPAEYDVLDRGTETPLRHGSGIGLWIVKWGVDHLGGRISFDERDPEGTLVTVAVPIDRAASGAGDDGNEAPEPPADGPSAATGSVSRRAPPDAGR
ncbi:ATP-binding protein, partial [Halorubrum sp. SS5]